MKTCHVPRRTWLDSKISVLLEELAESGMRLDRQRAGELITGQVRAVAALMGVTEASARRYLGDEAVKDMARRMCLRSPPNGPAPICWRRRGPFRCRWSSWGSASLPWPRQCRYGRRKSRPITCGTSSPPTPRHCPGSARSPRRHARTGRRPGSDPVPAGVAASRGQVHQRRRRPRRERRQAPGRDPRGGTRAAGRDLAPGR